MVQRRNSSDVQVCRVDGPAGSAVYVSGGIPLFVRSPVLTIPKATTFLHGCGITVRVDLRDPENPLDRASPQIPDWVLSSHPLPTSDWLRGETDFTNAYLRRRLEIWNAVQATHALTDAGDVPLIHCRAGVDRTGCVVAALLVTAYGWTIDAAAADYADVARKAGCAGSPEEVTPLLLTLVA